MAAMDRTGNDMVGETSNGWNVSRAVTATDYPRWALRAELIVGPQDHVDGYIVHGSALSALRAGTSPSIASRKRRMSATQASWSRLASEPLAMSE